MICIFCIIFCCQRKKLKEYEELYEVRIIHNEAKQEKKRKEEERNNECDKCNINKKTILVQPCGHVFCRQCANGNLTEENNETCKKCGKEISSKTDLHCD